MNGEIAQMIALVLHGNATIENELEREDAGFFPSNSTFKFCEFVRFVNIHRVLGYWWETSYAPSPQTWFARLGKEGIRSLRLGHSGLSGGERDRMTSGFVNGSGRWIIEALRPDSSDYWESHWRVGDRDRTDQRIWRVYYVRIARQQPLSVVTFPSVAEVRSRLQEILSQIASFANEKSLPWFAGRFEAAIERLSSHSPYHELYHSDFAPRDRKSLSSDQLLGAAQSAWVFGAMGSWNDLSFDGPDQTRYEELSEQLFQLLILAIVVAVNSTHQPSK